MVFFGLRTKDGAGNSVLRFGGTGFFVAFPAAPDPSSARFPYLVTAGHVAKALSGPFVIGINNTDGSLDPFDVDEGRWVYHPDYPSVDLAVLRLGLSGTDHAHIPYEWFADNEGNALFSRFGTGDLVYIVGLIDFSLVRRKFHRLCTLAMLAWRRMKKYP